MIALLSPSLSTQQHFDDLLGWIDPRDADHAAQVFHKYLDTAYGRAAVDSDGPEGTFVRARSLPR